MPLLVVVSSWVAAVSTFTSICSGSLKGTTSRLRVRTTSHGPGAMGQAGPIDGRHILGDVSVFQDAYWAATRAVDRTRSLPGRLVPVATLTSRSGESERPHGALPHDPPPESLDEGTEPEPALRHGLLDVVRGA